MSERKWSVRRARMELDFALVQGNQDKIKEAEKRLEEALAEGKKRRAPKNTNHNKGEAA